MMTKQNDTMAMTDQELEQVNGGVLPLLPLIVLGGVLVGVVWGASKMLDGYDEVQDAADGAKKRSCR